LSQIESLSRAFHVSFRGRHFINDAERRQLTKSGAFLRELTAIEEDVFELQCVGHLLRHKSRRAYRSIAQQTTATTQQQQSDSATCQMSDSSIGIDNKQTFDVVNEQVNIDNEVDDNKNNNNNNNNNNDDDDDQTQPLEDEEESSTSTTNAIQSFVDSECVDEAGHVRETNAVVFLDTYAHNQDEKEHNGPTSANVDRVQIKVMSSSISESIGSTSIKQRIEIALQARQQAQKITLAHGIVCFLLFVFCV